MKHIYLETLFNKRKKIQGWYNSKKNRLKKTK